MDTLQLSGPNPSTSARTSEIAEESSLSDDEKSEMERLSNNPCKVSLILLLERGLAAKSRRARGALEEAKIAGMCCQTCYDAILERDIMIRNMRWELENREKKRSEAKQIEESSTELLNRMSIVSFEAEECACEAGAKARATSCELEAQREKIYKLEEALLASREEVRTLQERIVSCNSGSMLTNWGSLATRSTNRFKTQLQTLKGHIFLVRSSLQAARIFVVAFLNTTLDEMNCAAVKLETATNK